MIQIRNMQKTLLRTASVALIFGGGATIATADEPCGELEECRVFIEINASDGDIGFHVLLDAEGWVEAEISDPNDEEIFEEEADEELKDQTLTENFFESAEHLCEAGLAEEEDDIVQTLPEFFERFPAGHYDIEVEHDDGGESAGTTMFTHLIPAAPAEVDFDGSVISWEYGDDLGECTTFPPMFMLLEEDDIVGYEVVLEPEDESDFSGFNFTVQVPRVVNSVTVPTEYLASLDANTPLKVEVGAIEERPNGSFGNTTFTEEDGFCNNADQEMCPEEEAEEEAEEED